MRVDLGRIRGEYDQNTLYAHMNFFKNKGIIKRSPNNKQFNTNKQLEARLEMPSYFPVVVSSL